MTLIKEIRCRSGTMYKVWKDKSGNYLENYLEERIRITQPEAISIMHSKKPARECALLFCKSTFRYKGVA